jgi:hypothetical protein
MNRTSNHSSETTPGRPGAASVFLRAIGILQADHLRLEGIVLKNGGWRCGHCEAVQAPGDTRYRRDNEYLCRECFEEIQHAAQRWRNTPCS